MAGQNIRVSWTAAADAQRQYWRIYATDEPDTEKGALLAEVDPDDRSYLIRDVGEGVLCVRVVGVGMGGTEEDWTGAAKSTRVITKREVVPSAPTQAAATRVDASSAISVSVSPPLTDDPEQDTEVIRGGDTGTSADWGQLVATQPTLRSDAQGDGGQRVTQPAVPVGTGVGTGDEVYSVRGVSRTGRAAGTASSIRIPSVALPNYDAVVIGSVVTGTLTNIYAPDSTLGWDHNSDGVGLRQIPTSGTLGTGSGWGTSGTGRLAGEPSGAYFTTVATISISTYDLGSVKDPVVLECWDNARRDHGYNMLGTIESRRLNSMPSNPVEGGLDGTDISPDWAMHRVRSDGSPFRPLPPTRWRVQYGESAVDESGWLEYQPGMIVRARYVRAQMILSDPLGWYRTLVPRAYFRAWTPHRDAVIGSLGASGLPHPSVLQPVGYGGMSKKDGTTAYSIGTTPVVVKPYVNEMSLGNVSVSTTNGTITPTYTGIYDVKFATSFSGDVGDIECYLYNDGTVTDFGFHRTIGSGTDVGSASLGGLIEISAGTSIDVRVEHSSDSKEWTPESLEFWISRVE